MAEWMLWGRFGGSIQLGSAPPPRLYLIPLSSSIEHEGPLASEMGHRNRNERTLEAVTRALDRAVSGEFDGVIFPSAILLREDRHEIYSRCQSRGLKIVHQVTNESLQAESLSNEPFTGFRFALNEPAETPKRDPGISRLDELLRRLDAGDALNLVFGATSSLKETLFARLTRWPDQVYFTYSARAKDPVIELLHGLQPFVRERLFFHFPYHLEFGDGHFSCREVYELTERIHSRVPGIKVRPMLGTENFDPRVDPELELEPTHAPLFQTKVSGRQAQSPTPLAVTTNAYDISVIIPSYNNRDYLLNTIKHLSRQDLAPERFEIVVVDDGSNDGSLEAVRNLVMPLDGKLNFKYIHSPRLKPRKMGDANYRAGISRNLGVKNADGRIFCFLDSDILTPTGFLSDLIEKHKRYDVIQCKRLNLVREKSDADIRFDEIDPTKDTFFTEGGYWEHFYSLKDWSKEPFFWKYTCTYGLSVPATLFKRVGWIRRGFVFYGFEDVELGYRLAKVGSRFHLNEVVTYHLFHRNERSEFHNSDYLRQMLLAKTAQIFYLGLLEPEIFFHFRGLMKEQLPLSSLFKAGARKLGLGGLERGWANWLAVRPGSDKSANAKLLWLMIPFVAIWNWRWFIWKQIQAGKKNRYLRPAAIATETVLRAIESVVSSLGRAPSTVGHVGQETTGRLGLSPRSTAWEALLGQTWIATVPARRIASALQLWRIRVAAQWVGSHVWKIKVPLIRVQGAMARTVAKIPFWKLRESFKSGLKQLWRVQVFFERLYGSILLVIAKLQLWRIRILLERARAQTWRINVIGQQVVVEWTKFLGSLRRLMGWVYGRALEGRTLWTTLFAPKLSALLHKTSYPVRKIYYFTSYQWKTRFGTNRKEPS